MPTVKKVGQDPKKQTQVTVYKDQNTGAVLTTATEYWNVVFDSAEDDPLQALGATDGSHTVPVIDDFYPGSSTVKVIRTVPQLDTASAGKIYRVQVDYSSPTFSGSSGKWDTQVSFDGLPVQETAYYDLDNAPYINAAGQNFSTQPNNTYYDEAVKVAFKTDSFDEEDAAAIRGYLNASDITLTVSALSFSRTFPAKTLKLDNFTASPVVQLGALAYWQVSLNFTYRALVTAPSQCQQPDGTDLSGTSISTLEFNIVPNMGYAYLDDPSTDTDLTPFLAKDGVTPMNSPQLLDFDGGDARPTGTPTPDDTYFIAFRAANTGDFSVLFTGIS